jgi:hypothetical protein
LEHSIPIIPNGLYCLDQDVCDYFCNNADEQHENRGVACGNPDLSVSCGIRHLTETHDMKQRGVQRGIAAGDKVATEFGRFVVSTKIMDTGYEKLRLVGTNNDHVGSQVTYMEKHDGNIVDTNRNTLVMSDDMVIDDFAALDVKAQMEYLDHIMLLQNTFIENTLVDKMLTTQTTFINNMTNVNKEITNANSNLKTIITAQEKQIQSLKDVINNQTFLNNINSSVLEMAVNIIHNTVRDTHDHMEYQNDIIHYLFQRIKKNTTKDNFRKENNNYDKYRKEKEPIHTIHYGKGRSNVKVLMELFLQGDDEQSTERAAIRKYLHEIILKERDTYTNSCLGNRSISTYGQSTNLSIHTSPVPHLGNIAVPSSLKYSHNYDYNDNKDTNVLNDNDDPTPYNTDPRNDNNIGYAVTDYTEVMNDNDYPTPYDTDPMDDNCNDYSLNANTNNNEPNTNIATSGQWEVAGWLEVRTNKKSSIADPVKGNMFELDYLQDSLHHNCSCDLPPEEVIYPQLKPDHSFLALVKQLDPLVGDVLDNKMITLRPKAWLSSNTINALCDIWNRLPHF